MNAIPTRYAGVQFRSRLEARWAAFFDLLGFPWQYEPFDCHGYIPDFLLFGRLLLEVKPIVWNNRDESAIAEAQSKLEAAAEIARCESIALVGVDVHEIPPGAALCGLSAERRQRLVNGDFQQDQNWTWSDLHLDWWPSDNEVSFDGQPIFGAHHLDFVSFKMLWREAGNRVQWRGASSVATHGGAQPPLTERVPPAELAAFFRALAEDN